MSQPEIFRRCTGCGASFREGALFCPQCGSGTTQNALTGEESGQEFSNTHVAAQEQVADSGFISEQREAFGESPVSPQEPQRNLDQTMPLLNPTATSPAAVAQQAMAAKASAADRPKHTGAPAGLPDPRSENRVMAGVDKLRKGASNTYGRFVIEEFVADSGLRFVFIAGFLFLLFVVLLVLSKWMN